MSASCSNSADLQLWRGGDGVKHLAIMLIIAAYLGLALLYNVVTPLGEGPDEPGHAGYAFFLAREGRLPVQRGSAQESDVPGEGHQPPLAYALAALALLWLPPDQRSFDLPANPRFTWAGGHQVNAAAHGSREYLPWSGGVLAWRLARAASSLAGALTIAATYLAALTIGYGRSTALLAAGLVAFNPQFLFMSALITNDPLLTALSAVVLLLAVQAAVRGMSTTRAALLGLALGLALITKQSALLLAPVALLAAGTGALYREGFTGGWRAAARHGLRRAGLVAAVAGLVSGWWYARNIQLYGDPLGLQLFRAEFVTQPFNASDPAAWSAAIGQLFASFWARFGWMNVFPPAWTIWCYAALTALALLALAWHRRQHRWQLATHWPLLALPALAFGWVVAFAFTAGLVAWQGRLLFPALPAIAIVLAIGLDTLANRVPRLVTSLAISALCALALWMPLGVIRPAYPFYTLPEQVALERLGMPVYARFGLRGEPGAELRGWRLTGEPRPGNTIKVTLIWHALGRQNRDWTVFVHLVDASERIVAEDNRQPLDGAFPMTQWVAGDWIEDPHPLALPADLSPGQYRLRVGLYDREGEGRRTGMFDAAGDLRGDYLELGTIRIAE